MSMIANSSESFIAAQQAAQAVAAQLTIDALQAATAEHWQHPARLGNVVVLSEEQADDVLITADLHGHRDNFERILALADLEHHPRRHLVLQEVIHGGPRYENGGCQSHLMLEATAHLKLQFPGRVHTLLSNHELSEMTDYPLMKDGQILLLSFRLGLQAAYGTAADAVHAAYCEFIRSCPLAIYLPGGVFLSHSVPERIPEQGWDVGVLSRTLTTRDYAVEGEAGRVVWGRDYRAGNAQAFAELVQARLLIHGHTPCVRGFSQPNPWQLILDCCHDDGVCLLLPVNPAQRPARIEETLYRLRP